MASEGIGRTAAIIGGGTMGTDIAAIFCAGGWGVEIVEPERSRWPAATERVARAAMQLGAPAPRPVLRASLGEVDWQHIEVVVECAPEELALKRRVFADLERLAPAHVALASNSSSLPISAIGEGLATRSRMLGLHFFMPAHLVPAVEVIRGEATDPAVCERCAELMRSLGKVPVNVRKDVPGFLANRLQHALTREAFALIDEGFASPEDVDAAVRYGFGFRFVAAGPVLQKDIAGLDIHCAAAATMYPHLANDDRPARVLRERVAAGKLGMKSGEGFYRWTPESAQRERDRYERALLDALAILKREDSGR
jgi:3-hydroxybutyryl-CoA dehydrogenase